MPKLTQRLLHGQEVLEERSVDPFRRDALGFSGSVHGI